MADGIKITEGSFDDIDLTSDFLDGTIKGVITEFAKNLQDDLIKSLNKPRGKYNNRLLNSGELAQSLAVVPNVIEGDDTLIYVLEIPSYGMYQDKGVDGTDKKYPNSIGAFKESSKAPTFALVQWAKTKFGLTIPQDMTPTQFGMVAAFNRKKFGIKPTYWLSDVIDDGRVEELEEQIGKKIGFIV